jgi:hypothetical protein
LTINLTAGVRRGDVFDIALRQITEAAGEVEPTIALASHAVASSTTGTRNRFTWRIPVGAFQISINISTKDQLLFREERLLSWLRYVLQVVPTQNRWYPVLQRYTEQISGRVRGFGGDPDQILPSPDGTAGGGPGPAAALCEHGLKWLVPLFLAIFLVLVTMAPSVWAAPLSVAAINLILVSAIYWYWRCKPKACDLFCALILGLSVACLVLGSLVLLGYGNASVLFMLALLGVIVGVIVFIGKWRGCCGCSRK